MLRETAASILLEMAEAEMISWESIARGCLGYMSEDDVADMALAEGLLDDEKDDDFSFEDEAMRVSGLDEDETLNEIFK